MLLITGFTTAILAIYLIFLSILTISARRRFKVSLADNGELDLIKFISTYKTIQDLIKDKDTITEYKQKISQLKKENTMLKHQLWLINKLIKNTTEIVSNEDICEQKDTAQTNNQNETDVYLSVPIDKCDENNEAI